MNYSIASAAFFEQSRLFFALSIDHKPEIIMASALVSAAIKQHSVVMFSKSYCPFCDKAKALLKERNIAFTAFELGGWVGGFVVFLG